MKMQLIIRGLVAVHIIGVVIMAGTTMIDYLTFRTFWKLADHGEARSLGLIPLMARYGALIRMGAVTLILTGIALIILQKTDWLHQFWFKVKLGMFFLLLLNGIFVGNTQGHRFRETVTAHASDFTEHSVQVRKNLGLFYPVQLTLFLLLISISMMQPDKIKS